MHFYHITWSASPGKQSLDMWIHNTHHIELGPEHKISSECIFRNSLQTWIHITLVWSISLKISLECISRKTSLDMDIHHIGLEHISENMSRVYLQKIISGH